MSILNRLLIFLLLCGTVHAEEVCRIYPGGTGDGIPDVVVSRASSVTGIDAYGELVTYDAYAYNSNNLVVNSDMELDSNWADDGFDNGETNERSSTRFFNGSYSRHIIVDDASEGIASDGVSVTSGQTYLVSVWVYVVSGECRLIRKQGHVGSISDSSTTTGTWEYLEEETTATSTGLENFGVRSADGGAEFYVDKFVVKASSGAELSTRDFKMQSLPASSWTQELEYSEDFTEWAATRGSVASGVSSPDGGSNGYSFTPTTENGDHYIGSGAPGIAVSEGDALTFSIFLDPVEAVNPRVEVYYYDSTPAYISGSATDIFNTSDIISEGFERFGDYYRIVATTTVPDLTPDVAYVEFLAYPTSTTAGWNGTDIAANIFGANVTKTAYPLPYTESDGSTTSVAGQTMTVDISGADKLRDALSDSDASDTDSESIATYLFKWVPRYNNPDTAHNLLAVSDAATGLLSVDSANDRFLMTDGTNTAYSQSSVFGDDSGTEYWLKGTIDSTADGGSGEMQLCTSANSGENWSCGTAVAYDGSMALGNNLNYGYNSEYLFDAGMTIFYDEVLTNAEATAALSVNQKAAGLLP
jgi:hypothetical protein